MGGLNIEKDVDDKLYTEFVFSVLEFSQESFVVRLYLAGLKAGSVLILSRCKDKNNGPLTLHVFSKNVKIDATVANEILIPFSKNITSLQV